MSEIKINDRELLRLVDSGMSQSAAAKALGVSRQAVSKRLIELRGRTTKAIVARNVQQVVDRKIDAVSQLAEINAKAMAMLDEAENNPELRLKCMAEIRGQLRLQLEIFQSVYDLKAAQEFQEEVLQAIGEVSPDVRSRIIHNLNQKRAIRSAIKLY